MHSITIKNSYLFHEHWIFGIEVTGKCPVFVGCSFTDTFDHPGEWLESEGLALFEINFPFSIQQEFKEIRSINFGFPTAENLAKSKPILYSGKIMFALWRDDTFQERLADTGWVKWEKPLIRNKAEQRKKEELEMMEIYGERLDVWR